MKDNWIVEGEVAETREEWAEEEYVLLFENPDDEKKELIQEIEPFCKEHYTVHSSSGVEVVNMIVGILNLILLLASYPLLIKSFEDKTIAVKFKGFNLSGKPKEIIKRVKENPKMRKELKKAYEKEKLKIKGDIKSVEEFEKKLEELFA